MFDYRLLFFAVSLYAFVEAYIESMYQDSLRERPRKRLKRKTRSQ